MRFELDATDTDNYQKLKDKALMLKVICLDEIGKDPMTNVSAMTKRDKVKLKVEIEKKWDAMPDADILKLFNEICVESIFDVNGMEVEHMPVGISNGPTLPDAEVERISALPPEDQLKICGRILCDEVVA